MNRTRSLRMLALVVVVCLPLLGMSGVASAKNAVGSAKWCAAHPKKAAANAACASAAGSGTGSGTGGTSPALTVQVDPTPLVETGGSLVDAVIQLETSPSFAGAPVDISSSQFEAACGGVIGFQNTVTAGLNSVQLFLDD